MNEFNFIKTLQSHKQIYVIKYPCNYNNVQIVFTYVLNAEL